MNIGFKDMTNVLAFTLNTSLFIPVKYTDLFSMKYLFLPFLSLGLLFSVSCANSNSKSGNEDQTASLESMRTEIMAVHDEIMPMMMGKGEFVVLQQDLKAKLDSLAKAGATEEEAKPYETAIMNLNLAQQKMNVWMDNYKDPDYTKPDSARAYYESQMNQIQAVADLTGESMTVAKGLLAQ